MRNLSTLRSAHDIVRDVHVVHRFSDVDLIVGIVCFIYCFCAVDRRLVELKLLQTGTGQRGRQDVIRIVRFVIVSVGPGKT